MQNKRLNLSLISIPTELLIEAGITENSVVEMYMDNGDIVIHKAEDVSEYVCDMDCENCPFSYTECEDDCENCPCREHCEDYIESEEN